MKPENRYLVCPRDGDPLVEHRDYHYQVQIRCARGRCKYRTERYDRPSLAWKEHEDFVDQLWDEGEED